jgi:DNA-binding response OmpR family regulator
MLKNRTDARRKILLVEDDWAATELVRFILADEFDVEEAPNSALALERFERFRPDLLILDMRLGDGTDGIDVFQEIRRRLGHAPEAILLSSADEAESSARALGIPVLRKPIRRLELLETVRRALAQGSNKPRSS